MIVDALFQLSASWAPRCALESSSQVRKGRKRQLTVLHTSSVFHSDVSWGLFFRLRTPALIFAVGFVVVGDGIGAIDVLTLLRPGSVTPKLMNIV